VRAPVGAARQFREGDAVLAIRCHVARNAVAGGEEDDEAEIAEILQWRASGSEHIGVHIGKR